MSSTDENRSYGRGGLPAVPDLTGLQFLVVSILFEGEMTSNGLREELMQRGYTGSRVAFSRLMGRMIKNAIVTYAFWEGTLQSPDNLERQHRYRVSNLGVILWKMTRKFYLSFDPPPDDLEAEEVSAAEFVEYGPTQRDKMAVGKLMDELNEGLDQLVKEYYE